jgi:hypothetical protein
MLVIITLCLLALSITASRRSRLLQESCFACPPEKYLFNGYRIVPDRRVFIPKRFSWSPISLDEPWYHHLVESQRPARSLKEESVSVNKI